MRQLWCIPKGALAHFNLQYWYCIIGRAVLFRPEQSSVGRLAASRTILLHSLLLSLVRSILSIFISVRSLMSSTLLSFDFSFFSFAIESFYILYTLCGNKNRTFITFEITLRNMARYQLEINSSVYMSSCPSVTLVSQAYAVQGIEIYFTTYNRAMFLVS